MIDEERSLALAALRGGELDHVDAVKRAVLEFVQEHIDALLRANTTAHLTASALVVDPVDARFVVLHHRKLDKWLQPGGHADGDGSLHGVALREAVEETGLEGLTVDVRAIDLDDHEVRPPGEPPHHHLDLRFLVLAPPGAADLGPPPGNHESHEVRWIRESDLDELDADESLRRLVRRGLTRLSSGGPG